MSSIRPCVKRSWFRLVGKESSSAIKIRQLLVPKTAPLGFDSWMRNSNVASKASLQMRSIPFRGCNEWWMQYGAGWYMNAWEARMKTEGFGKESSTWKALGHNQDADRLEKFTSIEIHFALRLHVLHLSKLTFHGSTGLKDFESSGLWTPGPCKCPAINKVQWCTMVACHLEFSWIFDPAAEAISLLSIGPCGSWAVSPKTRTNAVAARSPPQHTNMHKYAQWWRLCCHSFSQHFRTDLLDLVTPANAETSTVS